MTTILLVIILSIVFSAFFSGMEIAFISSNRLRIEIDKKQAGINSKLISIFASNSSLYITTMLIGNTIFLVIYCFFFVELLSPFFNDYSNFVWPIILTQTITITLFFLIFAEFLPKVIFRNYSNEALNIFAIPIFLFYIMFFPLTFLINSILKLLVKTTTKAGFSTNNTDSHFGKSDLDSLISDGTDRMQNTGELSHNLQLFQNALDFSAIKIRECMVPRNEIVAVEINQSPEELRTLFIETGLSKILVYQSSIDNVIGYIHSAELFKKPKTIRAKLLQLPIIPGTMAADKLLNIFIQQRKSIALVVDEYGGTAGVVTMEDIVEQIFGDIEDEHDVSDFIEKQISDDEFILSARLEIYYVNEKFRLNIPESDYYETIAGFIFNTHESLPEVGQEILIDNFKITILKVSQTRIETVRIKITDKENQI